MFLPESVQSLGVPSILGLHGRYIGCKQPCKGQKLVRQVLDRSVAAAGGRGALLESIGRMHRPLPLHIHWEWSASIPTRYSTQALQPFAVARLEFAAAIHRMQRDGTFTTFLDRPHTLLEAVRFRIRCCACVSGSDSHDVSHLVPSHARHWLHWLGLCLCLCLVHTTTPCPHICTGSTTHLCPKILTNQLT